MYLPKHFDPQSKAAVIRLVKENPFCVLIHGDQISHLPLVLEERGEDWILHGHMARANPHWKNFATPALVIAQGPHAYVSASWYKEKEKHVPTWNYVVAHLRGQMKILETEEETIESLRKTVDAMEPGSFSIPPDLTGRISKAIAAFEIHVESFESKFKLSQNRSQEDAARVMAALAAQKDTQSVELSEWMRRYTFPAV